MNEQQHWNKIGERYNEEIFDVYASDRNKVLLRYLDLHANPTATAFDFGCGNGKALPYLTSRFKKIVAADISENLLLDAGRRGYNNVSLLHRNLADKDADLPKADFVFSCNVIMLPSQEANRQMFMNVARSLKTGGSALLVVPSAESMLFTAWTLTELYRKEGVLHDDINPDEFDYFQGSRSEIANGIFYINDVPTRHYTAPGLDVVTREAGLSITALEKLEYDWTSELESPPRSLKGPYPWDWMVECRKGG